MAALVLAAPSTAIIRSLALGDIAAHGDARDWAFTHLGIGLGTGPGATERPVRVAALEPLDLVVQSEPRLILQQRASGPTGAAIPLGAQVSAGTVGLALEIRALPDGMTISSGRPLGAGWRIPAAEAGHATIQPPPGFSGAIDLAVELRLSDDTLIDRGSMRREWLGRPTLVATMTEPVRGSAGLAPNATIKAQATERAHVHRNGAAIAASKHKLTAAGSGKSRRHARAAVRLSAPAADPTDVHFAGSHVGSDPDPHIRAVLVRDFWG